MIDFILRLFGVGSDIPRKIDTYQIIIALDNDAHVVVDALCYDEYIPRAIYRKHEVLYYTNPDHVTNWNRVPHANIKALENAKVLTDVELETIIRSRCDAMAKKWGVRKNKC